MKKKIFLMSRLLLIGIIVLLLMPSCNGNLPDESVLEEQSNQAAELSSLEAETINRMHFETAVSDSTPVFAFDIEKNGKQREMETGTEYAYQVDIFCPENPALISQSFSITSCEELTEKMISFVDIDCDEHLDIEVVYSGAAIANRTLQYYRWSVFEGTEYGQYEETPFFEMVTNGYKIYPETKQIIATAKSNAVLYTREMYQLTGTKNGGWLGHYELIGKEDADIVTDENENIYTVHISRQNSEVYVRQMAQEEYYENTTERDNYLRYGVGEAISQEEAHERLHNKCNTAKKVGENKSSEAEYPRSFMFEKMAVIDGVSCYSFRMSWLVDDHHWSFVDDMFVMPDGTILSSDKTPYLE